MSELLDLLDARHGHFRLESGHQGELWLDLDALQVSKVPANGNGGWVGWARRGRVRQSAR